MIIDRRKGQLALETSKTKWCKDIFEEVMKRIDHTLEICDPFALNNTLAWPFTNDINENSKADYNMDAIDFLNHLVLDGFSGEFDLVLFDPPFSFRQAEKYVGSVTNVYTAPAYVKRCFESIYKLLKPGGYVLKFGFNSTRDHRGLTLVQMWCINHGGNHNDTIVTLWQRQNEDITKFTTEEMLE